MASLGGILGGGGDGLPPRLRPPDGGTLGDDLGQRRIVHVQPLEGSNGQAQC